MATVITNPNAMNEGPAAVRTAYHTEAWYFRVNTPSQSVLDDIDDAVAEFRTAFPYLSWRFYGKTTVRSLKRLAQLVDDARFQQIIDNAPLKAKMEAILGLI